MKNMLKHLKTALIVSLAMFIICGLVYPVVLTGISKVLFNEQANGNIIEVDGKAVGVEFGGQDFTDERLFHGRPSAYNYNTYDTKEELQGPASGSANMASSNPALEERVKEDIAKFLEENPTVSIDEIPADLVTASGSGLDPHISVESALVQIDRVSKNTGLSEEELTKMIENNTEGKVFGVLGEDKVNVLKLNLELAKAINMI